MGIKDLLVVACLVLGCAHGFSLTLEEQETKDARPVVTLELVRSISKAQKSWRAVDPYTNHRFKHWSVADVKSLLNRKIPGPILPPGYDTPVFDGANSNRFDVPVKVIPENITLESLPKQFDARQKWWDCQPIPYIRDQGKCGSCWAFGTTSAMSDRMCIHSKGRYQNVLSALDIMSCCKYCTSRYGGYGCDGGESQDSYHYWKHVGLVTGDNYGTGIGCKPYLFPPQLIHTPSPTGSPVCVRACTNDEYNTTYWEDKVRAKHVYRIQENDTLAMMWDLYHNGPLSVSYRVFKDFPAYSSGVYVRTTDEVLGGHVVVLMGWGEEDGVPYWTVKNSWNKQWGHHGFFNIRRGTNEAGIEEEIVGGIPDVPENRGKLDLD